MLEIKFYGATGSSPSAFQNDELNELLGNFFNHCKDGGYNDVNEAIETFKNFDLIKGDSACVQMCFQNAPTMICDAGTGLIKLGKELVHTKGDDKEIFIFISHTHWEHIIGLPNFAPLFKDDYKINIMGCHADLESRLKVLFDDSHSSVQFSDVKAKVNFIELQPGKSYSLRNIKVSPMKLDHPGDSFGYKFESDGKSVIYTTDTGYHCFESNEKQKELLKSTDILIFDGMYNFKDYLAKAHLGHSTPFIGVDLAVKNDIKNLILFHHNPDYSHSYLKSLLNDTKDYKQKNFPEANLEVAIAHEGGVFTL